MTLAFLAYPIAAFFGHPGGKEVLSNLLWPHFLHTHAFLFLAVALIGTTITPYMQFYVASAVVDKGIKPADYPGERIDTVNGAIWSDIISIFIIIATAAAIGGTGPLQSARQAAEALEPVVGPAAPALFGLGPARRVAARGVGRAAVDRLRHRRRDRRAPVGLGKLPAGAALLRAVHAADRRRRGGGAAPGNLVSLVVNAQVLNGIITPMLLTYVLILANRKRRAGNGRQRPVFKVVATLCVAVVGVLSFVVLVQTVAGFV